MARYTITFRTDSHGNRREDQVLQHVGAVQVGPASVTFGNADSQIMAIVPLDQIEYCSCPERDVEAATIVQPTKPTLAFPLSGGAAGPRG